jgi:hypothetical protein
MQLHVDPPLTVNVQVSVVPETAALTVALEPPVVTPQIGVQPERATVIGQVADPAVVQWYVAGPCDHTGFVEAPPEVRKSPTATSARIAGADVPCASQIPPVVFVAVLASTVVLEA